MCEWGMMTYFVSFPSGRRPPYPHAASKPLLHSLFHTPNPLHLPLDSLVEDERYRFRMSALDLAEAMVWRAEGDDGDDEEGLLSSLCVVCVFVVD